MFNKGGFYAFVPVMIPYAKVQSAGPVSGVVSRVGLLRASVTESRWA